MHQDFLSDTELYFSHQIVNNTITIADEEFHHIKDVMRHVIGDKINVTDGKGNLYNSRIIEIGKKGLSAEIIDRIEYKNQLGRITFCIPRLKSPDRFEFALEKCVELGITNFIIFDSERTVAKGAKVERWQKILLSAMKQSLRAWLPNVSYCKSIKELMKNEGNIILFDQHAEISFNSIIDSELLNQDSYLIFGPEGGFSDAELELMEASLKVGLTANRLRSETAVIAAATQIAFKSVQLFS